MVDERLFYGYVIVLANKGRLPHTSFVTVTMGSLLCWLRQRVSTIHHNYLVASSYWIAMSSTHSCILSVNPILAYALDTSYWVALGKGIAENKNYHSTVLYLRYCVANWPAGVHPCLWCHVARAECHPTYLVYDSRQYDITSLNIDDKYTYLGSQPCLRQVMLSLLLVKV